MTQKRSRWDLAAVAVQPTSRSAATHPSSHDQEEGSFELNSNHARSLESDRVEPIDAGFGLHSDDDDCPAFYPLPPLPMAPRGPSLSPEDTRSDVTYDGAEEPQGPSSPGSTPTLGAVSVGSPFTVQGAQETAKTIVPSMYNAHVLSATSDQLTAPNSERQRAASMTDAVAVHGEGAESSVVQPLHLGIEMLPPIHLSLDNIRTSSQSPGSTALPSSSSSAGLKLPPRPSWLPSPLSSSRADSKVTSNVVADATHQKPTIDSGARKEMSIVGAASPPEGLSLSQPKKLTKAEVAAAAAEAAKTAAAIAAKMKKKSLQLPEKPSSLPVRLSNTASNIKITTKPGLRLGLPAKPAIANLSPEELERQWMEKEQEAAAKLEEQRKLAEEEAKAQRIREEERAKAEAEAQRKQKEEEDAAKVAREAHERAQDPEGLTLEERARADKLADLKAKFSKKPGDKRTFAEITEMEAKWPERKRTSSGKTRISRWSQPAAEVPPSIAGNPKPKRHKAKVNRSTSLSMPPFREQGRDAADHPPIALPSAYNDSEYDPTAPPTLLLNTLSGGPSGLSDTFTSHANSFPASAIDHGDRGIDRANESFPHLEGPPTAMHWVNGPQNVPGGQASFFGDGARDYMNGSDDVQSIQYGQTYGHSHPELPFGRHPSFDARPTHLDGPRPHFIAPRPHPGRPRPSLGGPRPVPAYGVRPRPSWNGQRAGPQGSWSPSESHSGTSSADRTPIPADPEYQQHIPPPQQQQYSQQQQQQQQNSISWPLTIPGRSRSDGYRPPSDNGYRPPPRPHTAMTSFNASSPIPFDDGYGNPPLGSTAFEQSDHGQADHLQQYPYNGQGNFHFQDFTQQGSYGTPSSSHQHDYQ